MTRLTAVGVAGAVVFAIGLAVMFWFGAVHTACTGTGQLCADTTHSDGPGVVTGLIATLAGLALLLVVALRSGRP